MVPHIGHVSDKGISKWEKGYTTPSIYQLVAICHASNIKEGPSYFTKNFQKPALLNDISIKWVYNQTKSTNNSLLVLFSYGIVFVWRFFCEVIL